MISDEQITIQPTPQKYFDEARIHEIARRILHNACGPKTFDDEDFDFTCNLLRQITKTSHAAGVAEERKRILHILEEAKEEENPDADPVGLCDEIKRRIESEGK